MVSLRRRLAAAVALALLVGFLGSSRAGAQDGGSLEDIFRALLTALDAVQTQLEAGDIARARPFYDVFENVWLGSEDTVRNRWGSGYHAVVDAMQALRSALDRRPADAAAARLALAELRGVVRGVQARASTDGPPATPAAAPAATPTPAPAAPASSGSRPNEADCARYSAEAARPYLEYARALAGDAPIPGVPPAQSVVPQYAFGPGPVPNSVYSGPYGAVYPYFSAYGPAGPLGGSGAALGTPQLTSRAVYQGLLVGGQLSPFLSAVPGSLQRSDLISLVDQQNQEIENRIALGAMQQSVVGNQLNVSNARQNWINTYLGFFDRARQLALSACGRIP